MSSPAINPFVPHHPERGEAEAPASSLHVPVVQEGVQPRRKPLTIQSVALYEKWGKSLGAGFQVMPDVLIRHQTKLGLSAQDIVVLLNLNMAWWQVERMPFPRVATIAKRMGTSERTVQRALAHLEEKRLIERRLEGGKQYYDLRPLAERLTKLAPTDPLYLEPEVPHRVASASSRMANEAPPAGEQSGLGP